MQFKGLKLSIYAPSRQVIVRNKVKPNFALDIDGYNMCVKFINDVENNNL